MLRGQGPQEGSHSWTTAELDLDLERHNRERWVEAWMPTNYVSESMWVNSVRSARSHLEMEMKPESRSKEMEETQKAKATSPEK